MPHRSTRPVPARIHHRDFVSGNMNPESFMKRAELEPGRESERPPKVRSKRCRGKELSADGLLILHRLVSV
jgi:hypothetical protein